MIIYRTKHKEVKAINASLVLHLAANNWSQLPTWFKKKFQDNKIMIGGTVVQIETDHGLVDAGSDDMVFMDDKRALHVMKEKEFHENYEDIFCTSINMKAGAGIESTGFRAK